MTTRLTEAATTLADQWARENPRIADAIRALHQSGKTLPQLMTTAINNHEHGVDWQWVAGLQTWVLRYLARLGWDA